VMRTLARSGQLNSSGFGVRVFDSDQWIIDLAWK